MGNMYGYARVSTKDQREDRQIFVLQNFGIEDSKIYLDKQSGKDFKRCSYQQLIKRLKPQDVVVVKSIDRFGRNYGEILEQWRVITKDKGADIVVLDMQLLDTREKGKDLTGLFISDLILQILSYVSETERENIKQRQMEGISAAKARGIHMGRPPKPVPCNFNEIVEMWRNKEIPLTEAMQRVGCSRSYLYSKSKSTHTDLSR